LAAPSQSIRSPPDVYRLYGVAWSVTCVPHQSTTHPSTRPPTHLPIRRRHSPCPRVTPGAMQITGVDTFTFLLIHSLGMRYLEALVFSLIVILITCYSINLYVPLSTCLLTCPINV